jgi:succinate-semialdehyde dehydrogenase/glutarate-semialdehyde dehydrogenase
VQLAVVGRMLNTGQACAASKRFIVQSSVYAEFVERFLQGMAALVAGDPLEGSTSVGPLVNETALAHALEQIEQAREHGATIATGGNRIDRTGFFLEPTVLTGVTRDNPVFRQEIFAPVAMVFEVASEDEAIAVANDNPYGLGGSIMSTDAARAERVAERLETGMVWINHLPDSQPNLPFGGVKRSGYGRELSDLGITEFVNWRLIRAA